MDYIYASPLKRAHETAEIVASHLDKPVQSFDCLKEAWFFIAPELPAFSTPTTILDNAPIDGKEGNEVYQMFRSQVIQAMQDILNRHFDGTILIVVHGGTAETAIRLLLGSDSFTVNMGNTTLHSLTWNDKRWHIEYIDRWEHLRDI